jgi:hypothetical protein
MFEQQILCHKLPKSFDFIQIDNYEQQCVNKRNKTIQDAKRRMFNVELEQYEINIQHYECLYEQELTTFESETFKTNSYQMSRLDMLMYFVKIYVYHHTNILMRQIRFKKSCLHVRLSRRHHRQLLSTQKNIDVYPQIIVDVAKISLNRSQLDYLSHNDKLRITFSSSFNHEIHYRILLILFLSL